MNQQQVKYTIERVGQIERKKLDALRTACTIKASWLPAERRVSLIRTGRVKLRADVTEITHHTDVTAVFDFSKYEWGQSYTKDYAEREAAIKADASRIKDEIMLGDHHAALELLRKFEA